MSLPKYSVRMHSRRNGRHHSGAEQLVGETALEEAALRLLRRALEHERGRAESISLRIEELDGRTLLHGALPRLRTMAAADVRTARESAIALLERAGVTAAVAELAIDVLAGGASPGGGNMRGAMLLGARSGRRLESDGARGVRASRMDISAEAAVRLESALAAAGLERTRVREALVLAAKVLAAPGVVAELCWSDDPGYTTGYVAAPSLGYVRIDPLKKVGDEHGGRVFFVDETADVSALIHFLERQAFLVSDVSAICGQDV